MNQTWISGGFPIFNNGTFIWGLSITRVETIGAGEGACFDGQTKGVPMKLNNPRKKRLTLKQLIASLVIDPETGVVIWAGNRRKQRGSFPERKDSDCLNQVLKGLTFPPKPTE